MSEGEKWLNEMIEISKRKLYPENYKMNNKIKIGFFDKVFKSNDYISTLFEIVNLREQCDYILKSWEKIDIMTAITNYRDIQRSMAKFQLYSFDEKGMMADLGPEAVIERLKNDRQKMLTLLKDVKEVDLNPIYIKMRDDKINQVIK